MRWAALLLSCVLLAGCTWPDVAPSETAPGEASATPPATSPIVTPWKPCVEPTIAPVNEPLPLRPGVGLVLRVDVFPRCPEPRLTFGGDCPGELLTVELEHASGERLGVLRENGPFVPRASPCPSQVAKSEPTLPPGYSLSRTLSWNGTIAEPCEDAPGCVAYRVLGAGHYTITVRVYERGMVSNVASYTFMIAPHCARITLYTNTTGSARDLQLTLDNHTVLGFEPTSDGGFLVGWCGDPGYHWVRFEDAARQLAEEAQLPFWGDVVEIRTEPLRVEPLVLTWS